MKKADEQLPSPEKVARELAEVEATMSRVVKAYKAVYVASLRPNGGGSVGQIGSKGSASDPTSSAALSPEKNQLRYAARAIARAVRKAESTLARAEERSWEVFQELPGGHLREEYERKRDVRREWRVHRWTILACGCASDEEGWWEVVGSCSEHVPLIPEPYRTPFVEVGRGRYGPFQPTGGGE